MRLRVTVRVESGERENRGVAEKRREELERSEKRGMSAKEKKGSFF